MKSSSQPFRCRGRGAARNDRERLAPFLRMWSIVVALRHRAYTLNMLARKFNCHQRTIRRDLYALESILPLYTVGGREIGEVVYWKIGPVEEWPRDEDSPICELRSA